MTGIYPGFDLARLAQWANLRPPLTAMPEERARELAAVLERGFEFEAMPA